MNNQPPDNAFTTSTLTESPDAPAPPSPSPASAAMLATIVPFALAVGGIISCAALWLLSGGNAVMRLAGALVLLSDIIVALFLRFHFLKRAASNSNRDN